MGHKYAEIKKTRIAGKTPHGRGKLRTITVFSVKEKLTKLT